MARIAHSASTVRSPANFPRAPPYLNCMQNQNPSKQAKNTSKVLTALEKFNVARERACQEIQVEVTKNEKALQRIRFALGQAILDESSRTTENQQGPEGDGWV